MAPKGSTCPKMHVHPTILAHATKATIAQWVIKGWLGRYFVGLVISIGKRTMKIKISFTCTIKQQQK